MAGVNQPGMVSPRSHPSGASRDPSLTAPRTQCSIEERCAASCTPYVIPGRELLRANPETRDRVRCWIPGLRALHASRNDELVLWFPAHQIVDALVLLDLEAEPAVQPH